uniref:uncharacterized protein LOC120344871 n=1 Tax=Styela clava TaxID=7725 RepID=UPI00193A4C89|nr:uncharacterized protein LOC120344871 [Styela clava]
MILDRIILARVGKTVFQNAKMNEAGENFHVELHVNNVTTYDKETSRDGVTSKTVETSTISDLGQTYLVREILSITFSIATVYLLLSLTIYHIKMWKKTQTESSTSRDWKMIAMNLSIFLSIVFAFVRFILEFNTMWPWRRYSDINCIGIKKAKILSVIISVNFVSTAYWFRQRSLYMIPTLHHLSNKYTRFLSVGILPILCGLFVASAIYYTVQNMGYASLPPYGCNNTSDLLPISLASVTLFFMQVVLLGLFIYPLLRHRRYCKILHQDDDEQKKIMSLLKRAGVSASICVLILFLGIVLHFTTTGVVDDVGMIISDVVIMFTILGPILSFSDWRNRFFPFTLK